jgi:hypothetical protein
MRLCVTLILSAMTVASVRLAAQGNPAPTLASPAVAPVAPALSGPIIQADNPRYDFGKAEAGEKIHHTYIITNTGNEMLHITNVQPSCHCTTAGDWTHDIAPGQSGKITVQLDTTGFNTGAPVQRTITVHSNAKNDPRMALVIKGSVWKAIDVLPSTAMLNIPPDDTNEVTATVRIVNQTGNPITLSHAVSATHSLNAVVKEIKPGQEFQLLITAQPPFTPGTVWGTVTVNTSLAKTPIISVPVMTRVTPPIQISPFQIVLNPMPDRWTTNRVNIHGNTTNLLALSNPKASDNRIQVDVQPQGAKGSFTLLVAFPPGFQLEPGQHAEVTLDSNNPRSPTLKIPIIEYPRSKRVAALPPHPNPAAGPAALTPVRINPPQPADHP